MHLTSICLIPTAEIPMDCPRKMALQSSCAFHYQLQFASTSELFILDNFTNSLTVLQSIAYLLQLVHLNQVIPPNLPRYQNNLSGNT